MLVHSTDVSIHLLVHCGLDTCECMYIVLGTIYAVEVHVHNQKALGLPQKCVGSYHGEPVCSCDTDFTLSIQSKPTTMARPID